LALPNFKTVPHLPLYYAVVFLLAALGLPWIIWLTAGRPFGFIAGSATNYENRHRFAKFL
jgi:hypothetical protein